MRLDRPVGTLLLLWPTLAALVMAADGLPLDSDRNFHCGDVHHAQRGLRHQRLRRPKGRWCCEAHQGSPLVTGAVSERQALSLFVGLVAGSGLLILFLNTTTQLLAVAGWGWQSFTPL